MRSERVRKGECGHQLKGASLALTTRTFPCLLQSLEWTPTHFWHLLNVFCISGISTKSLFFHLFKVRKRSEWGKKALNLLLQVSQTLTCVHLHFSQMLTKPHKQPLLYGSFHYRWKTCSPSSSLLFLSTMSKL